MMSLLFSFFHFLTQGRRGENKKKMVKQNERERKNYFIRKNEEKREKKKITMKDNSVNYKKEETPEPKRAFLYTVEEKEIKT
ncbi:hypothetical protein ANTQUA_LOCUS3193 [Anthophora quadrimaculata]